MASIYIGTTIEAKVTASFKGESKSDITPFPLNDPDTDFVAEFYTKGKRETKSISIDKSECFFEDNVLDSFIAHVDTSELPAGNLCCTVSGTYLDTEHTVDEENPIIIPFVFAIEFDDYKLMKKYL